MTTSGTTKPETGTGTAADVSLPPGVSEAIARVWDGVTSGGESIKPVAVQERFRQRLARDLGPSWTSFADQIAVRSATPPFAVIVRGHGPERARSLLAAVAVAAGEMIDPYPERLPDFPVQQEIVPPRRQSPDLVWHWHTDSANWPVPNDCSALACLRAARDGGATQILSLDTLRASAAWHAGLAPLWESEHVWPVESVLGDGTFRAASITPERLRFRRELMSGRGSAAFRRAVSEFVALADRTAPDVSALLCPGDVLVFDNTRVMHRSGPVDDPDGRRLLLRTKIRRIGR